MTRGALHHNEQGVCLVCHGAREMHQFWSRSLQVSVLYLFGEALACRTFSPRRPRRGAMDWNSLPPLPLLPFLPPRPPPRRPDSSGGRGVAAGEESPTPLPPIIPLHMQLR